MTIEQEFFEAFGIPKGKCPNKYKKWGRNCQDYQENHLCTKCGKYPPITPEIVLKLEDVILTETSHISHIQKYGYPILDKKNKKRIGIDWNYIYVAEVYAGCDKYDCQNYDRFEGRGKTRQDALLNLCIRLKDELQDQVRECF